MSEAAALPVAFHDLDEGSFPFIIEFVAERTGRVVHRIDVVGPGAIAVPGLAAEHGPVRVRTTFPGDEIIEATRRR